MPRRLPRSVVRGIGSRHHRIPLRFARQLVSLLKTRLSETGPARFAFRGNFPVTPPALTLPWKLLGALASELAHRKWHGRVVGQAVTQVWEGYASRIFISFGELTPSTYVRRNGAPGRPHGKLELSNMLSESGWVLTLDGYLLADWESPDRKRYKALQRLVGKRLLRVEIDERSPSTVLSFSAGIAITTANVPGSREARPHWSMRIAKNDWPPVALPGTAYRWRLENRHHSP